MFNPMIVSTAETILKGNGKGVSRDLALELAALMEAHGLEAFMEFIACAAKIRERFKANKVFTCAIINAKSGLCSEDCAFCAQSGHHRAKPATYDLQDEDTLVANAKEMEAAGATQFSIVTSGLALSEADMETVCRAVSRIKAQTRMTVCASVGTLTAATAGQLKQSGLDRYHHNLETAPSFFDQICSTHTYEADMETVRVAKAAGLTVCSGGIMGLGESWDQRVELAFTLKNLEADSIPLNFLNPIPGTPLEHRPRMKPLEALACIALFRFILPRADITICGGRETTLGDFQSWIFPAGANGLMVGNYLTTQGRDIHTDLETLKQLGLIHEPH